jgi:hypothetical protein
MCLKNTRATLAAMILIVGLAFVILNKMTIIKDRVVLSGPQARHARGMLDVFSTFVTLIRYASNYFMDFVKTTTNVGQAGVMKKYARKSSRKMIYATVTRTVAKIFLVGTTSFP